MMRARTVPSPMPFPIRAVLIGINVSARKDKSGSKKQGNELALLEFSLSRTYYLKEFEWLLQMRQQVTIVN
jgi:hypothetical protein